MLDFPYSGQRVGVPARVSTEPLKLDVPLDTHGVPVVAIAGTCMNSGKTAAACAIVSRFRHNGLVVDAIKSTGVALRRDILAMEDSGARHIAMFSDFGICATTSKNAPALTRSLLNELSDEKPDAIVFELGDGLLGAYGVEAILRDKEIVEQITAMVLCANDPVGAWGGAKLLREEFGIEPTVISGPATDNQVGIDIISERSNVAALNAMTSSAELGDLLQASIGLGSPDGEGAAHEHDREDSDDRARRLGLRRRRVLAAHRGPSRARARRRRLDEPSRRAGREDVPASRAGVSRHAVRLARRRRRAPEHGAALAAAVGGAARRLGGAHRSAA